MKRLGYVAALACAALTIAPAAVPYRASAATRDWSKTTTVTPDGAFVLGNPRAKVRLVEYLSMTCTHCARFSGEALVPLTEKYIRGGLVSLEARHAIRDSLDIAATLLARCNGARAYFSTAPALLAMQDDWLRAAVAFQQADQGAVAKRPIGEALAALAQGAGLDRMVAARGLPAARAKACLANKAEQDRLAAMAKEAWGTRAIPGTPAFLIDGTLVDGVTTWATLEPKLQEALHAAHAGDSHRSVSLPVRSADRPL